MGIYFKTNSIPKEIHIISLATGIRWIGWGMAEPLIPVFLFSLLGNYGMSGVVGSAGQIVFFLILPIAGIFADRMSLKKFLVVGLIFFLFDGLWALAALSSLIVFAFLADFFDGIAVASDVVGRATYIRRYVPQERVATIMGFQATVIHLGWMIGAMGSFFAVRFLSLPWIFSIIIPTNLIALYLVIRYLRDDKASLLKDSAEKFSFPSYFQVWRDVSRWRNGLRFLAGLTIFLNALVDFGTFLIPIYAYVNGANFQEIIILGIIAMLPELFSSPLGKIADKWSKNLLPLGLITIGLLIASLTTTASYAFLLVTVLILKIVLVLLGLVIENLVTSRAQPSHYGRVSAVFEGLKDLGKFVGAIGLGFAIDAFGSHVIFLALAVIAFLIAAFTVNRFNVRDIQKIGLE